MKTKHKINVLQFFIVSIIIAGLLLALDIFISNRLSTNIERIVSTIIFNILAIPLFVLGAIKSIKMKYSSWAALNILAIIAIIVWTIWTCIILYAFKDFPLVIPA